MDKDHTIESIQNARKAHESQMEKIALLIEGKAVENPTAVSQTKCEFGKWLYSDDHHIKQILGSQFYDNIETLHSRWHVEYVRIFNIVFKEEKKSFLSKFLGVQKLDPMTLDKVKLYHSELNVTTSELLKALASSERRIMALPESKFR
ncbi:CZB domain-containing protein [bacterium]|nr:CZB domain-containing protein [bacterium]MBU1993867.1 CZB domain-containing protein [bacterium]